MAWGVGAITDGSNPMGGGDGEGGGIDGVGRDSDSPPTSSAHDIAIALDWLLGRTAACTWLGDMPLGTACAGAGSEPRGADAGADAGAWGATTTASASGASGASGAARAAGGTASAAFDEDRPGVGSGGSPRAVP